MIPKLDAYADLNSPLHRWDPRLKLIGFAALIFAFSLVNWLPLLPAMVGVSLILYQVSGLPGSHLLNSLKFPGLFIVMLAVILPLFYGRTILLQLGFLTLRLEGCVQLLLIAAKFFSILVLGLVLFATATFQVNITALRAIGLPLILTDMAWFSYRYLFEFAAMLRTMQIATRLRGFRDHRLRGLRTYAHLAGTMLVRSYEQSDRVYKAMILRGYGEPAGDQGHAEEFALYSRNLPMLALFILLAAGFIIVQALCAGT